MTSTIAPTKTVAKAASIPEFGGQDARLYSTAEVAALAGVKDGAAWLRRRKIATVTRVWRSQRAGTVRLTLADPATVRVNLSAPAFKKENDAR